MPEVRVRGVYGTPWSKLAEGLTVTPRTLRKLGECLVGIFSKESATYFAKRGWSGQDPMGGPPIWDSFSYSLRGRSTLEVHSTFYGLAEMASKGGIPGRKMTWLTQDRKDASPNRYKRSPMEKKLGMKRGGRISKGERLPLVVPIKSAQGAIIFRTAPLRTNDAWVHPGIARFTFIENAVRKGRKMCAKILAAEVVAAFTKGDSSK